MFVCVHETRAILLSLVALQTDKCISVPRICIDLTYSHLQCATPALSQCIYGVLCFVGRVYERLWVYVHEGEYECVYLAARKVCKQLERRYWIHEAGNVKECAIVAN